MKIPRKLPKAELNIAPASFPPMAFVKITADETGGGMQATTNIPRNNILFRLVVNCNDLTKADIAVGIKMKVKLCINK